MGMEFRVVDTNFSNKRHVSLFDVEHRTVKRDDQCDAFSNTHYWVLHSTLEPLLSHIHHKGTINEYQK